VFNAEGHHVGTADLSDVEMQFMKLQKQVSRLSLSHTREIRCSADRTISPLERKGTGPARPTTTGYRQDKRSTASWIHRGGAVDDFDDNLLNDFFPEPAPSSKNNVSLSAHQKSGP
jgi:hypothetical protein